MKGVIFTELVRFMETVQSPAFADAVIDAAALPNDGAFTSVGNYPSAHALSLVTQASEQSGIEIAELCRLFGQHLYRRFHILYPHIMEAYTDAEALLTHVGSHIHLEVCTLYPDARPPQVETTVEDGKTIISYQSHRPLAAIALGLIQGCMEYFNDPRTLVWDVAENSKTARFYISGDTRPDVDADDGSTGAQIGAAS